jgi:alpha-galactosidase
LSEPVTSGRGRNGPWLQNRWLRIETRLDDGSISPVSLSGPFRPAERAQASVTLGDGRELLFARADYDLRPHEDALGAGRRLALRSRTPGGFVLEREVVLYDDRPACFLRVCVRNEGGEAVRLGLLRVFSVRGEGRARLRADSTPDLWRFYRNGWQSWSPTMSLSGRQPDLRSAPPVLAPEPPPDGDGRFASEDVGVLFDPACGRALLSGAVTARDFMTRVQLDAPARGIEACCLADGLPLAPGDEAWSERVAVDLTGHPNEQLERYGDALGTEMGARVPSRAPSGWCSWYYFFTQVTEDDVVRNLRFLESHRDELPVDTVQIDDGYQADIGDWLTANEKFPHGMAWLASEIRSAGYTPGLWLAPFLIADSSRAYAEHPEWVVRDDAGEPVVATNNWQRRNFGLDGTHPEARAWLRDLFREVCDGWGYDYVKIDFLFGAAVAGRRYDAGATRVRAYRQALAAVREGTGDARFILGCGSPMAPSVGYFDGNRIGPDVAPFWRFLTREERTRPRPRPRQPDDNLSAEGAIRNTLTRSWMHNRLWANDPDCLLVRTDRTKLTLEEVRTLTAAIGLSGGMVLSSDDLDRVPAERRDLVAMLLPALPQAARPVDLMETDMPERYEVTLDGGAGPRRVVGLFNFEDEARNLVLPLPEGAWHGVELWSERYLGVGDGAFEFALVERHGCRVVAVTPATGRPLVLATTAHIGMGAIDISDESYDEAGRVLAATLLPVGRRRRAVFVDPAGLDVVRAAFDGREVELEPAGGCLRLEVEISAPARVEIRFGRPIMEEKHPRPGKGGETEV